FCPRTRNRRPTMVTSRMMGTETALADNNPPGAGSHRPQALEARMNARGIAVAASRITKVALVGSAFVFLGASAACGSSSGPAPAAGSDTQQDQVDIATTPCNLHTSFGDADGD